MGTYIVREAMVILIMTLMVVCICEIERGRTTDQRFKCFLRAVR